MLLVEAICNMRCFASYVIGERLKFSSSQITTLSRFSESVSVKALTHNLRFHLCRCFTIKPINSCQFLWNAVGIYLLKEKIMSSSVLIA